MSALLMLECLSAYYMKLFSTQNQCSDAEKTDGVKQRLLLISIGVLEKFRLVLLIKMKYS